jgi:hypothetical protein
MSDAWPDLHIAVPTITRAQQRLLDAAVDIAQQPGTVKDAAYMAAQLVQCTLPHTDPGDVPVWMRKSKRAGLILQPGWDANTNRSLGYPYGTLPRLILFWVTTHAIRTRSRRLELGESFAAFMRELGLDPNHGGKRGDAHRLRDQMRRLFACAITLQCWTLDGHGEHRADMKIAPKTWLWWSAKHPEQPTLWTSAIELGEDFFNAILASPVPVDLRALRALKRSPLALDLYAWATYTTFLATRDGRARDVPWRALAKQLGAEYGDVKDFKKHVLPILRKVRTVYPAFTFTAKSGGLWVYPSRAAIEPAT